MIKDTVAPIPIEELKEYFNDDSIVFNIDYANSTLKGNKLLTYISNLDIPVQLSGFYELSYEEKEEFVLAYMNSKLIVNLEDIEKTILYYLLVQLGFETPVGDFDNVYITNINSSAGTAIESEANNETSHLDGNSNLKIFNHDELETFLENNEEVIKRWIIAIASGSVYNVVSIKDSDNNSIFPAEKEFEVLDDYDYVGVNYVKLFAYEKTQLIMTYEGCPVYYMKKQFEENMFKGKNLHYFFINENNFMSMFTFGIANGYIDYEGYNEAIEKDIEANAF